MKKKTVFLLFCAAVFYWLCRRAYYVGFFNDDAFFIIGARSLLQGRFVELNQPGFPPLVHYPPGYPILLMLISWIPTTSFVPYQLLSMMLVIFGLIFYWFFSMPHGDENTTFIVLVLTAFCPIIVSMSGTVMSDIAYFTVSMLILWIVDRWSNEMTIRRLVVISLMCVFCFYTRPIGGVFALAVTAVLALDRRWKETLLFNGIFAAAVLPYFARNYFARGQWLPIASEYGSHYTDSFGFSGVLSSVVSNAAYYARELFVTNLFRWRGAFALLFLQSLTLVTGVFFSAVGFVKKNKSAWAKLPWLYLLLYLSVLLAWDRQCSRYILPIVPLVLGLFFDGVHFFEQRNRWRPVLTGFFFLLALVLYAPTVKNILNVSLRGRTRLNTPTERTFEWIRGHTQPEDIFTTEWDGQFFLYTGRRCFHLPKLSDRNEFADWAKFNNSSYVLLSPVDLIVKTNSGNLAYEPLPPGLAAGLVSDEKVFEKVFEDESEGTVVYHRKAGKEIQTALDTERFRT